MKFLKFIMYLDFFFYDLGVKCFIFSFYFLFSFKKLFTNFYILFVYYQKFNVSSAWVNLVAGEVLSLCKSTSSGCPVSDS